MPSVRVELTKKEMDAAEEFAKQCGESVSELMRKLIIRDATLADGYGADDSSYDFKLILPPEGWRSSDREAMERTYNRVRRILGWSEIQL